jgi:hypothetical protein
MPVSWIIEPVDIFKQGQFNLSSRLPGAAPDELSLESFEEGLYSRIIITIPFPAHRCKEAIFLEPFFDNGESSIDCHDRYDGCSLWVAYEVPQPCLMPGWPDHASCGC